MDCQRSSIRATLAASLLFVPSFFCQPTFGMTLGTQDAMRVDPVGFNPRRPYQTESFARSVAASGKTVVIGHPGRDDPSFSGPQYYHGLYRGELQVLSLNETGEWDSTAILKPANLSRGDGVGRKVAIDGNLIVAGSVAADGSADTSGTAWIFGRNSADQWIELGQLSPSTRTSGGYFSDSLAIGQRTIVVGAPRENSGAVYVYQENNTGKWKESIRLEPPASESDSRSRFGESVSIFGDTIVVGASDAMRASPNRGGRGAAYVYRFAEGRWIHTSTLGSTNPRNLGFGYRVSIWEDTIAVTADHGGIGASDAGAVYIFKETSNGQWNQVARLTIDGELDNTHFGESLSLYDDKLLVGATGKDYEGYSLSTGAAYLFRELRTGDWGQVAELNSLDDSAYNDRFGETVSLTEDFAWIGASRKYLFEYRYRVGAAYGYTIPEPTTLMQIWTFAILLMMIRCRPNSLASSPSDSEVESIT